jgi:hypothetical protein
VLVIAMPRLCINTLYNKHLRDTIPFAKNHTVFAESVRGVIASSFLAKQSPDMARRLLQPAPNAGFAMTLPKINPPRQLVRRGGIVFRWKFY